MLGGEQAQGFIEFAVFLDSQHFMARNLSDAG